MKKYIIKILFLFFPFHILYAQPGCPAVSVSPANVSICSGCTTLTDTVTDTFSLISLFKSEINFSSKEDKSLIYIQIIKVNVTG